MKVRNLDLRKERNNIDKRISKDEIKYLFFLLLIDLLEKCSSKLQ